MRHNGFGLITMKGQTPLLEACLQGKNWHSLPNLLLLTTVKNGGITLPLRKKHNFGKELSKAFDVFCQKLDITELTHLYLSTYQSDNALGIKDDTLEILLDNLPTKFPKLTSLYLLDNQIGGRGARKLAVTPQLDEVVVVGNTSLSIEGKKSLLSSPCIRLLGLDFYQARPFDEGTYQLVDFFSTTPYSAIEEVSQPRIQATKWSISEDITVTDKIKKRLEINKGCKEQYPILRKQGFTAQYTIPLACYKTTMLPSATSTSIKEAAHPFADAILPLMQEIFKFAGLRGVFEPVHFQKITTALWKAQGKEEISINHLLVAQSFFQKIGNSDKNSSPSISEKEESFKDLTTRNTLH